MIKPYVLIKFEVRDRHSFVVGDSRVDVRAARRLGALGCLVRTGWAADPSVAEEAAPDASIVVSSLAEAADWILHF